MNEMLSDDSEQLLLTIVDLAMRNILVTLYQLQLKHTKPFDQIMEEFKDKIIDDQ